MITLKNYQQRALAALEKYLKLARLIGPEEAFERVVREEPTDRQPQLYRPRWGLTDVPYVCLRLPTGGGKTLLAAHSVSIAASNFMERDFPLVLWLVPTNMIRKQTAEALKNPSHPYREALNDAFGQDRVAVFDIEDINNIRPKDLSDKTCVVLATMQTLRVSDSNKDARKVYGHNENFDPHFKALPNIAPGLDRMDGRPDGQVLYSFVNILHQLRPLVIVDEAHKAVSGLSGEMMQRINPACVVEMTATPVAGNVLYRVYASDLKTEEMVKLPFLLTEHAGWEQAVNGAVQTRLKLADLAVKDSDAYIRPLVLFQAEKKDQQYTVEVLKKHLLENEGIADSEIAVATGEQRELDSINLFDKTCPVNYIITIEALKEGWDCSFAYVFCSVANIRSAVDVEQLLGRVMRMPYARKRRIDELNKAYAHVVSPSFAAAADSMYDRLVNMGFNAEEAAASIIQHPLLLGLDYDTLPLFRAAQKEEPILLELPAAPDIEHLPEEERGRITVTSTGAGTFKVEYRGPGSDIVEEAVLAAAPGQGDEIRRKFAMRRARERQKNPLTPSQKGQTLTIGRLMLNLWDSLELPEAETILMATDWSPLKHDVGMTPDEFRYDESARTFEFDLEGEKMRYHQADEQVRYALLADAAAWDERGLSCWLDRQCRQSDVRPEDMLEFCRRSVHSLLRLGSFDLELLCRAKYALAAALKSKLAKLRERALRDGHQLLFFSPERKVKMDLSKPHKFPLPVYAESCSAYTGAYGFKKHYYPVIHDLKSSGEEFECARALDMHPSVKIWVRNVDRQEGSFKLPLYNGWFYPDFVAELLDGRRLVVEYKGGHLIGSADTEAKLNIGELWEKEGKGKHIFLMAVKEDSLGNTVDRQIAAAIAG
jgi:type III restriction enzyme